MQAASLALFFEERACLVHLFDDVAEAGDLVTDQAGCHGHLGRVGDMFGDGGWVRVVEGGCGWVGVGDEFQGSGGGGQSKEGIDGNEIGLGDG